MAQTKVFVTLLQKNGVNDNRAIYTDSVIPNTENNLADWLIRAEITNTGVSKVNTGSLKLRIDEKGTFVRASPILVDEATKNNSDIGKFFFSKTSINFLPTLPVAPTIAIFMVLIQLLY